MNKEKEFRSPLIAFSAPSGAGKTTIVKYLAQKYSQTVISVSATTRTKRKNEQDGKDYLFLSDDQFRQFILEQKFLEYEHVHGKYYGTLINTVEKFVNQGKVVLFDIDVNGALAIKKKYQEALLIFIKPPSVEKLIERLNGRETETDATIKKRLERLDLEYAQAEFFDYTIINDELQDTIRQVESVVLKTL